MRLPCERAGGDSVGPLQDTKRILNGVRTLLNDARDQVKATDAREQAGQELLQASRKVLESSSLRSSTEPNSFDASPKELRQAIGRYESRGSDSGLNTRIKESKQCV